SSEAGTGRTRAVAHRGNWAADTPAEDTGAEDSAAGNTAAVRVAGTREGGAAEGGSGQVAPFGVVGAARLSVARGPQCEKPTRSRARKPRISMTTSSQLLPI